MWEAFQTADGKAETDIARPLSDANVGKFRRVRHYFVERRGCAYEPS